MDQSVTACDVLVVGGSGRVGASTLRWLDRLSHRDSVPLKLAIGGRNAAKIQLSRLRLGRPDLSFVHVDVDCDTATLVNAVRGAKLVVHTAGPFQGRSSPNLLNACIRAGIPYCDVCDELLLSRNAKALSAKAAAAGIPAVISCGIWPGVSALMAAKAVQHLGGIGACDRLEFSFHTAGTGGAGPTIVSATFLLLAADVETYVDGARTFQQPWTKSCLVDFGGEIGQRTCYLLDNPDVPSTAEVLGIANCSSSFGTAPGVWNSLFTVMKLLPGSLLNNRDLMQGFAHISMPIIRVVDAFVGATNAMRVDAYSMSETTGERGDHVTMRCVHSDLEDCVGQATAAFAIELLRGRIVSPSADATIAPGVWYPVELQADARSNILNVVREQALVWDV